MTETVCVTVEQLREIEVQVDDEGRLNWCPACEKLGMLPHEPDCWLAKAIAQAERLKDWKPKVGDRVRLKAMPEAGIYEVIETLGRMCRIKVTSGSKVVFGIDGQWRERAELMPEEGNGNA